MSILQNAAAAEEGECSRIPLCSSGAGVPRQADTARVTTVSSPFGLLFTSRIFRLQDFRND